MSLEISPTTLRQAKITLSLIAINSLIFLIVNVILGSEALYLLAQANHLIVNGQRIWSFFTSIFVHVDISHLIFNMFSLLIFGMFCEQFYAKWQYLVIYFVSGIVGSVFSFLFYLLRYGGSGMLVFGLGSSGAIYGLMAGTYLNVSRDSNRWYFFGIIYVVSQLFLSLDNWAHLFGFGSGVLLVFLFRKLEYKNYPKNKKKSRKSLGNFKNRLKFRRFFLKKSKNIPVQKTSEQETFDHFIRILQVESSIAIEQMAEFLHLSELDMMKRLIIWKKKLPFAISGEFIVVESMGEFLRALEDLSS